ncbi:MAG: hypothetical protein Q8J67_07400, partial [Rhodocyclaceae bacterium]|nr:hypothetical protein [Rhodocyclaceae bacterium]
MKHFAASLLLVIATAALAAPAPPVPQEIVLRHGLSGAPLDALATLVLRFNDQEAKLKTGAGRISLEDVQGISGTERARLPHL